MKKVNEEPLYEMRAGLREPGMMIKHPETSSKGNQRGRRDGDAVKATWGQG